VLHQESTQWLRGRAQLLLLLLLLLVTAYSNGQLVTAYSNGQCNGLSDVGISCHDDAF
jgi:hypothetical protein